MGIIMKDRLHLLEKTERTTYLMGTDFFLSTIR
jgi:hypothetical protein